MNEGQFRFICQVPAGGFRWLRAGQQWILTAVESDDAPPPRLVRPDRALFRQFIEIDPEDREAIAAFASNYGYLEWPRSFVVNGEPIEGEALEVWSSNIVGLKKAVELWDLIRAPKQSSLKRYFEAVEAGQGWYWRYRNPPKGEKRGRHDPGHCFNITPPKGASRDDVLTAARLAVETIANEMLRGQGSPCLVYAKGRHHLFTVANHLAGFLLLSFARSVAGNSEQRQCKECGVWFTIGIDKDARTARRAFCSVTCKSRDYRGRKATALRMHGEGQGVKAIAEATATPLGTVRGWLKKTH